MYAVVNMDQAVNFYGKHFYSTFFFAAHMEMDGKSRSYRVLWRAAVEFKCGRGCYVVRVVFTFYGGYEPENASRNFMN